MEGEVDPLRPGLNLCRDVDSVILSRPRCFLFAALVFAPLILRHAHPVVTLDDPFYLEYGAAMSRGELPYRDFMLPQMPGAEVIMGMYYSLFPESLLATQCLTAVVNWMTAWLLFETGCVLAGSIAGATAALLYSWSPLIFTHHVFEREIFTALLLIAVLRVAVAALSSGPAFRGAVLRSRPMGYTRGQIALMITLSAAGFFVKATFGLAALGVFVGMLRIDRRAALRYAAGFALLCIATVLALWSIFGDDFLLQAFLFQSMKGGTPLVQRLHCFFIATTPVLLPALAGIIMSCRSGNSARWFLICSTAAASSLLVLFGPTYWSHNAMDPLVPLSLLAAVGVERAFSSAAPDRNIIFSRFACVVSASLTVALFVGGKMLFVTEGVPRAEIHRVVSELNKQGRSGSLMHAPSMILFESRSRGLIRHPEFYGVYLWMKESVDEHGVFATLQSARADGFSPRMEREKTRWMEEVYRAIGELRVRTVVIEPNRREASDALDPARLIALGMTSCFRSDYYEIWINPS